MTELSSDRFTLMGVNGSPYSRKVRAILRYRHLPYNWVLRTTRNTHMIDHMKPFLIPVLFYPGESNGSMDSTPIAHRLEETHPNDRSIMPPDPALSFFNHLIEDMADEWLTKAMFHYRWMYDADIQYAKQWIIDERFPDATDADREKEMQAFSDRQIGRMPLVGCTEENRECVEKTYHSILEILEGQVNQHQFLFGSRPALADFALYGQLCVLAEDPTPLSIMREKAQQVESWLRVLDDASGITGTWQENSAPSDVLEKLLKMAGTAYLPFLEANRKALENGSESFSLEVDGAPYSQGTFKYQLKCLKSLQHHFTSLEQPAKANVVQALEQYDCLNILSQEFDAR